MFRVHVLSCVLYLENTTHLQLRSLLLFFRADVGFDSCELLAAFFGLCFKVERHFGVGGLGLPLTEEETARTAGLFLTAGDKTDFFLLNDVKLVEILQADVTLGTKTAPVGEAKRLVFARLFAAA
jgi:hypothetical protein